MTDERRDRSATAGLLIGGMNFFTKLFFIVPAILVLAGIAWSLLFGESRSPRYVQIGDCSIPGIARGSVLERTETVNGEKETIRSCGLNVLPGHWIVSPETYKKCVFTTTGELGVRRKIRTPGELGFTVTEIEICSIQRVLK